MTNESKGGGRETKKRFSREKRDVKRSEPVIGYRTAIRSAASFNCWPMVFCSPDLFNRTIWFPTGRIRKHAAPRPSCSPSPVYCLVAGAAVFEKPQQTARGHNGRSTLRSSSSPRRAVTKTLWHCCSAPSAKSIRIYSTVEFQHGLSSITTQHFGRIIILNNIYLRLIIVCYAEW